MRKLLRNKKGLTLVELLISIAVFIVIAGTAGIFIFQGLIFYRDELEGNIDEANVRNAVTQIINTMRKTTADKISTGNSTLIVDDDTYTFDEDNKSILLNGNVFIKDIDYFSVVPVSGAIEITVTTSSGRAVSTSFGLRPSE